MLESLAERYALALVSNFDHAEGGRELLVRFGIAQLFRSVHLSDEVGYIKPHGEIFRRALEEIGVAPEEVLFVGDTPEADIEGARALGIDACWINRRGRAFPKGCLSPTYTIADFSELPGLLDRRRAEGGSSLHRKEGKEWVRR